MKKYLLVCLLISCISAQAQYVEGKLTLNGKSKTSLELDSNSAVRLFKEFNSGKYRLQLSFDEKDLVKNLNKEAIIFFNFRTVVKKDGKLVKNVIRKYPIPYFPGEYSIPAEAFDFVGLLASDPQEEEVLQMMKEGTHGLIQAGEYSIELTVLPIGIKGKIAPVTFNFYGRKRPGKVK
ncbi:MAG: hypothetical protein HRT65_01650 [Flavobacteriaceae bacterium]|nr:hypothetical protein [Flavobacteriaceae bacterium]